MTNVIEFAAEAIIEYLLVGSVTAFVLVPLGWLIIRAGRIRAPVYRQLFWLYCLVGIALLPVLWLYGPKLTLAVLPAEAESVEVISAPATESGYDAVLFEEAVVETFPLPQATHMQVPSAAHSNTSSFPARTVLALLWLVGFALMLARLTVGWYRLHRICLTAMPVTDRSFFSDGDGRRPKVLLTSQVAGPVCFGLFRPVVMLPPQTYEASAAGELRMVLNHELAHIERGDCWANLFQRIVEAVFFFHPLVWWASLRLTQQREQICDNYVLARGASADEYSTLLARVVQRGPGKAQLPTMALFEGRLLQRVRFLLDPGRDSKTRLSIWAVLVCTIGLLSCLALLGAVRLEARSGADGSDTDGLWEGHSDGGAYQWSWLDPHEDESEVTWTAEKAFETAAKYDSGDGGERPRQRKALRLYQRVLDANPSRLLELRAKARMGIRMTQGYDSELGENSLDAEAVRWYEQMLQDFKDWGAHQHLLEARVRLGDVYFMGPYGQSGVEKAMDLYWEVINVPEEQVVFDEPRSAYLNLENIAKAKAKGRFVGFVGSDGKLMEPPESANRIYRQRLLKQRKSFIDGIRRSAIWAITNKLGDKRLGPPGKKLDRLLELKRKRPDDKYFQQILDGVIGGVKYTSLQQPEWLRYDRPYHSGARIRIDNRWPRGRVIDGAAKKYGVSGPVYVFDPCDPKLHKSMGIAASCEMLRIFSFDFINDKGRPRLDVAFQFQDGKVMGGALFEVDLLDKDMNLLGTQRTLELRNRQMPVERHGGTTEIGGDDPPNRSGKAEMRFDKVPIAEVYAYRLTVLEPDLPLLLELLDEENVYLRESAIKALEPMGPDARAIVPRLLKTSQDEREHVRNPDVRVIHFPKDRSMGLLYVGQLRTTGPLWWQGWEEVGEARGDVTVAGDKDVRLTVNAQGMENLSFLEALGPDDIQALEFSYADAKRVDDAALEHLAKLTGLRFLSLDNTSIHGTGLKHLTKLNNLEALSLDSVEISDEALKHVGQIGSLLCLDLGRTPVTDEGLVHLRGLSSLRRIELTQTSITGTGFSHLAGLESLTYAHLCDSGLTDEGLREVAKLNSLEILRLEGTKITGRGIGHLEHLTRLLELGLGGSDDITDASLAQIGKITSLEKLELPEGTTAAGLRKLTPLTNLKHLGIWQMRYTDDGLGPLRQFKNLQYLSLMTGITDEDLAAISALTSLEELIMNSSPITNKGLAQLAALKSLKRLTLHHGHKSVDMDITVSGVGALKGLPLKYLQLGNIKLDESRYSAIGAFAALEFLYLSSMPIIDEDLAVVGKLSQLKRLLFNTDTVSDGGLEYLAGLNRLEDFQPLTPLTDKGLYHIGKMRMKGRLIVKGHFTDEGLRNLEGLSSLRQLKITTSGEITDGAKERLKRKLPNLSIYNVQRSREVRRRPKVGEAAPPFALKPLDQDSDSDEEIRLEGKAVLLYFWATWCTPCKASTPALKQLYAELKKRHADRFVMLGLSLDSDETSVRRYIGKETIPWPQICIGRHSKVAADYGVTGVPMYYVIGPDQRVVFTDHDNGDTIEAAVDRALQDKVTSVRQAADEPIKRLEKHGSISEANHLEILDVKFEPIHQGKNVVRVNVQNTSGSQRIFAIHIYTRSTDYAPGGIGWGTRFFDTIKAKETKWSRFVFKIHGPVTDNTWLRLKFYNPASEEDYDYEKPFKQRRYESSDLIHEEDDERGVKPASTNQTQAVIEVFEKIQAYVREQEYEQAWQSFTKDYQEAEFQTLGLERFTKAMDSPAYGRFMWDKQQFLDLHPKSVTQKNGALSLTATVKEQNWKIDFLQEDGRWKIDWITGYRPAILDIIEADAAKVVDGKAKSELELLDVRFEPIRQGKNVVQVKVSNTSDQGQVFRLQIYTRSPDYGRSGVGWGTSFFDTIKPKEAKWTRFVFKIQGPVTDATYVRLDFHNPGPAAGFDREKYFEDKGPKKWFKRVKYSSSDLEHHKPDEIPTRPASESESEAAVAVFREIQKLMTDKKYEQAWELLTKDYQDAEFQSWGFKRFKKIMEPQKHNPIDSAFWWQKAQFLRLQPESVVKKEPALVLSARDGDQTWKIDFVQEDRQWKVDWIAGYTLRILQWQNWETRLLGKMEKRNTKHFDIHYEKASVAEKEIDEIAKNREAGYSAICEFLGQESQVRIKLVLFENERTKWFETGHQGRGWAYGNTTVEVYNEREQLDPYHETTHVLMRSYGGPPALFNEGFAVYMSEHLGAHALEDLGGGQATIYERVRELKKKAEWIELEELIAYTEIGSRESRPPVAYAEAASFVKFLIDEYGRDRFLEAYKTLRNSGKKQVHQQNIRELERIYGKSLQELQEDWEKAFSS